MKTLNPFIIIALFLLSNCTETIYDEVIKLDTVYLPAKPVAPTFITVSTEKECTSIDTLDINVVIKDVLQNGGIEKDTLVKLSMACHALIKIKGYVLVPKDSVAVPGPTEYLPGDSIPYPVPGPVEYLPGDSIPYPVYDTVWQVKIERQIIYKDTLYQPLYYRPLNHVPRELEFAVIDFYAQARERGWNLIGGPLVVQYKHDMAGENWNSFSYWIGEEQMVIEVNGALDPKYLYTAVLRELGRLQLKKKYVTSGDLIMNIYFPPEKVTIDSPEKEIYLSELFSNPI